MAKLVIITGGLATLKTTISKQLSKDLNIVCLNKDDMKEVLVDTIGFTNRIENKKLSIATVALMTKLAMEYSQLQKDIILEANFKPNELMELYTNTSLHEKDILTIDLVGDLDILFDRYIKRNPTRHRAHTSVDLMSKESFRESMLEHQITTCKGTLKRFDTSFFKDDNYQEVLSFVKDFLIIS
ncbi:MAG: hypothetical protein AB7U79_07995 [Candidatus Izemoplasmatales bacterium]